MPRYGWAAATQRQRQLLPDPAKFFETADLLADMRLGKQAALTLVPAADESG
jgi:hypothetical protein